MLKITFQIIITQDGRHPEILVLFQEIVFPEKIICNLKYFIIIVA